MTTARAPRLIAALLLMASMTRLAGAAGLPKVPDDFEIRVVANVPAVVYPCQVATGPDGSLFIAEDPMDQVGPYESNHGKILVMREGKDPVLFAEGFRAIFGMAWHDGALYVSHMPFLTILRDTDGDGKADSRKDIFKDLGITSNSGLNDHIVSGIQFGIDGYMYVSVGDKGVLKATGPDGKSAQIVGGGTLRCRPDGTGIEVISTGTRNHLEPNLDAQDNLFTYDNTDDGLGWWTRVTHHVDGGYHGYPYDYHADPDRFLDRIAEYAGGSPCGGVVYKEDAWPEKYRGRVIWSEWGKRKVSAFRFEPAGASFKVADIIDLAEVGDSGEFRPLDLALSYDGKTLYVADWGMGGWGTKTEKVGRVYAITYKGPAVATRPRGLDSDPLEAQFKHLDHASFNERMRAQAAIVKAGKSGLMTAVTMLAEGKADPVALRHLVWTIDAIAGGTPQATRPLIAAMTDSPIAEVRAQAARALGERRVKEAEYALIARLKDLDPTVKLQAIIALGRIGDPTAVPSLLPVLTDSDRYLAYSTRVAVRRIGDWKAVAVGLKTDDAKLRAAILAALERVYESDAVDVLQSVATDVKMVESERARALAELATVHRKTPAWDGKWWGTRPFAGKPPAKSIEWASTPMILRTIENSLADPAVAVRLVAVSSIRETDDRAALPTLRSRFAVEKDVEVRKQVALALGAMADKPSLAMLVAALRDLAVPEPVRSASLEGVEAIGGKDAAKALIDVLNDPLVPLKSEARVRVISALGRSKSKDAIPTILGNLKDAAPEARVASLEALGKIGQSTDVAPRIRLTLADPSVDVRKAAMGAIAALKDRDSIPALLPSANDASTKYEATLALAAMPDVRALQVYLAGLGDKSPDVRKASVLALSEIRDKAEPILEQLGNRREIPTSALPELRKVYNQLTPVGNWHVMGPFPFNDRSPVQQGKAVDLTHTAPGPDGSPIPWVAAIAKPVTGEVNLFEIYRGKSDCSAFGYAEVDSPTARPAQMSVGSDDTLTVWLNGKQVYKFDGNRGYEADSSHVDVELKKGKNLLLIKCGNGVGPWAYSVALTSTTEYGFLKGPATGGFDPDKYRAMALKGGGKSEHGKALFNDLKGLACLKCHVVGGQGGAIGPELSGIAAKYPKEELVTSVLYPSQRIFSGYETTVVNLNDGKTVTGLVKSDTAAGLEIEDAEGKKTLIPKADIEDKKTSEVSLMPNGIVEGITAQDFADLIAYLETLKDAAANQGKVGGK